MKKIKAFSLLELMIVITILGFLFTGFQDAFQMKNKNAIKATSCTNNVYGKVRNYLDKAMTSRKILSGDKLMSVDKYIIRFNKNKVSLNYSGDSGFGTSEVLNLSGDGKSPYGCFQQKYNVSLTGDVPSEIILRKGLQGDINNPPFVLSGMNTTGNVEFLYHRSDDYRKSLVRIYVDKRVKSLRLKRCQQWTGQMNPGEYQACKKGY